DVSFSSAGAESSPASSWLLFSSCSSLRGWFSSSGVSESSCSVSSSPYCSATFMEASMLRTTREKACWSFMAAESPSMSLLALSSMKSRQRSSTLPAEAGGACPVSFSRTMRATASSSGASAWRVIAPKFALAYFSVSMVVRFCAMPGMRLEPMASTRACSTASKIARASAPCGDMVAWMRASWQALRSAIESPRPRVIATSVGEGRLASSGRRMRSPVMPGRSLAKVTSTSASPETARTQPVTARRNGSMSTTPPGLGFELSPRAAMRFTLPSGRRFQDDIGGAFLQFHAEGALVKFGNQRAFQFVALVEEGDAEGESEIAEDLGVFPPGDDRARAHHGRKIAVDEGGAGEVGDAYHARNRVAAILAGSKALHLGGNDADFVFMRQVIERCDDGPAVHLCLVDLLRAVVEAGRIAEADRVGGREQAEGGVRTDNAALVEQRQAAGGFQHTLDDEHHVRAAGIVFVEDERDIVLVGPGQDAVLEFGDLQSVLDDDGVLADEVDTADMAVEVDAHARPVEAGGDLLDMGRFASAV